MNDAVWTATPKLPEAARVLLKAAKPSEWFRALRAAGRLKEDFPELDACAGVPQSPVHHPEGDVFEHTMLVVDCAASLRCGAVRPLGFMLAALTHDLGKAVATEVHPDGRITAYRHETLGLDACERQLRRLTDGAELIEYVKNMMWLHMRPNMLALARSPKVKTRVLFDLSSCPEDLILLSKADASGKLDRPYDPQIEAFLRTRLADYRKRIARPMLTRQDLERAGFEPGSALERWLERARRLHLSGLDPDRALSQLIREARLESSSASTAKLIEISDREVRR